MDCRTPLWVAAANGHTETVKFLVSKGAHMEAADKNGNTPLMEAANWGNTDVVMHLVSRGAKVDAKANNGRTALDVATNEEIRCILTCGAKDWSKGLLKGAGVGDIPKCQQCLDKGANLEAGDIAGCTPLIMAAEGGHIETVKFLHSLGAKVEASDQYGCTALLHAASNDRKEVVAFMHSLGVRLDATTHYGRTPLWVAAGNGHKDTVMFLHSKGANPDVSDNEGSTALWWAAKCGRTEIVEFLVSKGATLDAKDDEGRTALAVAANPDIQSIITGTQSVRNAASSQFELREKSVIIGNLRAEVDDLTATIRQFEAAAAVAQAQSSRKETLLQEQRDQIDALGVEVATMKEDRELQRVRLQRMHYLDSESEVLQQKNATMEEMVTDLRAELAAKEQIVPSLTNILAIANTHGFPEWLKALPVDDTVRALFIKENVNEDAFEMLEESELKELGLTLGHRKLLARDVPMEQAMSPPWSKRCRRCCPATKA
ncbi:MAG: hypothetical protein COB65_14330 [Thalassobium sp.]|nr:MAG: hypothetical protein COB65_14330 [Thalassobium sp.]